MEFKGAFKRENIVAETLFPEMFPRRANEETFAEKAKCFRKNSETFLLPQQMFPGAANAETFACATLFPRLRAP